MFRLLWAASVRTRDILCYAPTNILLAAIRTRRGLKFGIPAMLLTVPYWIAAAACVNAVQDGGPGWLNLLALLAAWNMMKFILIGPISLVLLMRVRIQEAVTRRRARRRDESKDTTEQVIVSLV